MMREQLDKSTDSIHIMEWQITNFSSCLFKKGEQLKCPISTAGNLYNTRWELQVYPKGHKDYPNYLGCFVKRDQEENIGPEKLPIEIEFSLVTSDGVQAFKQQIAAKFKRNLRYGFPKFMKLEDIFCRKAFLLESDTLTLRCKLRLLPPKFTKSSHHIFETKYPIETLSKRFELEDFRNVTKKTPKGFVIQGPNELLCLKITMNKPPAAQVLNEANEKLEIPEKLLRMVMEENPSVAQVPKDADEIEEPAVPETFLRMVMDKKQWKDPIHVSCWVKLLNINQEFVLDKEFSHLFSKIDQDEEWILPYFIDTDNLGVDCIVNDTLKLDFDFTICHSKPVSSQIGALKPLKLKEDPRETTLMKDLVKLYETKKFTNVTLRVKNKMFSAHKSVLVTRSQRFKELLLDNGTESGIHLDILDVDRYTMEIMLKFIYTDELENMTAKRCLVVYAAAQKYKIPSLQFKCAMLARRNLSVDTVYRTLVIADLFRDLELKMAAVDFILENFQKV